MSSIQKCC